MFSYEFCKEDIFCGTPTDALFYQLIVWLCKLLVCQFQIYNAIIRNRKRRGSFYEIKVPRRSFNIYYNTYTWHLPALNV